MNHPLLCWIWITSWISLWLFCSLYFPKIHSWKVGKEHIALTPIIALMSIKGGSNLACLHSILTLSIKFWVIPTPEHTGFRWLQSFPRIGTRQWQHKQDVLLGWQENVLLEYCNQNMTQQFQPHQSKNVCKLTSLEFSLQNPHPLALCNWWANSCIRLLNGMHSNTTSLLHFSQTQLLYFVLCLQKISHNLLRTSRADIDANTQKLKQLFDTEAAIHRVAVIHVLLILWNNAVIYAADDCV